MLTWAVIVMTVTTLIVLYLGWRLIAPLPVGRKRKITLWLMLAILMYGHRITWFMQRSGSKYECLVCDSIDWVGFTFLGFISILIILMFVRDIPRLISSIMSSLNKLFVRRSKRPYFIEPDLDRRRFMLNATNGALFAAALPLTGYGMFNARREPAVVNSVLPVVGLPEGLDGFTIAQISDTHIGPTIRSGWARMVVDAVNRLGADMVVHTGDLVDGSVDGLKEDIAPMGELHASHGVWFCTGNHEYYSGVHEWLVEADRLGMTPLVNEHRLIDTGRGRILLAGVSDYRSQRIEPTHVSSPSAAMQGAPEFDVSILLAHQPNSIHEAAKAGFDVQLSGHTHGGQYFPYNFVIHLFQTYVRGLHLHEDTVLYVNTGTGYWGPPIRLGTTPEITLHTLKRV
ncbi:metallophosphoesterase [Pseudodesulfovibrio portus]|uniref:Calcineurin-like phosphoesterase n=1 Tax=Pseudodesulfovibrio portus TaxID=231439 RepID=A0ABM8AUH9_9BACT|nr:metallophosphoesterase [Pseudodesulfovibrio portus]BDQ35169.1 calcineurin-like phosphoesterase [Pseudodesulfovibrio portus]